jgi:hypothetical protein
MKGPHRRAVGACGWIESTPPSNRPRCPGRVSHLKQQVTLLDDPILRSASGHKALDQESALSIRRKHDADAALQPRTKQKTPREKKSHRTRNYQ